MGFCNNLKQIVCTTLLVVSYASAELDLIAASKTLQLTDDGINKCKVEAQEFKNYGSCKERMKDANDTTQFCDSIILYRPKVCFESPVLYCDMFVKGIFTICSLAHTFLQIMATTPTTSLKDSKDRIDWMIKILKAKYVSSTKESLLAELEREGAGLYKQDCKDTLKRQCDGGPAEKKDIYIPESCKLAGEDVKHQAGLELYLFCALNLLSNTYYFDNPNNKFSF